MAMVFQKRSVARSARLKKLVKNLGPLRHEFFHVLAYLPLYSSGYGRLALISVLEIAAWEVAR
jgi:hypothetical protein